MKSVFAAVFAGMVGCTFVQPAGAADTIFREKVVYSFCSQACRDGFFPSGGLIDVAGILYGTAQDGGLCGGGYGCGTVFSFDPGTGTETVLYLFCAQQACADGESPSARLVDAKGILYGTTYEGGNSGCGNGCGTVFSLDPGTGKEKVLYSFCAQKNCIDGASPPAGLKYIDGALYGTTYGGGTVGSGTVFSIDPGTGKERVLYSFCSQNCTDGSNPQAGLIDANGGILYGTTAGGGAYGYGTVFSLDPGTGAEKVIYSFAGKDGSEPGAGLLDVKGTLYGTTRNGGTGDCRGGCGTVFSLQPGTGTEKVLHSFGGGSDSQFPLTNLIEVNGTLYGTTEGGGGPGTVFSVDPATGAEKVLHSFCNEHCPDGTRPSSGLVALNGKLYGETAKGGVNCSCGTLYVLYPKKQ